MLDRILVAWAGSPTAQKALDAAVSLARRFEAEITAASVAHSPSHAETREDRDESIEAARAYLEQTFARLRDRAERVGVAVAHTVIEADEPVEAICRFAEEHGFDLIVVGHHRRRRAGRLLLHGLAERLMEASDTPVLVVPAESA